MSVTYHRATLRDTDPADLYRLLRLRLQVFVVEQDCPYEDLDGRDLEPDAELLWAAQDGQVLGTLRLLHDADGALRIGRVVAAPQARGQGVAAALMLQALARCDELDPAAPVVLGAQAHLADWYARFGFAVDGPQYDEDGIAHVPMRKAPAGPG